MSLALANKIKALKAPVWHLSREPIYGIDNLEKEKTKMCL